MAIRFDALGDSLSRTTGLPGITAYTMCGWFKISIDRNAFSTFLAFGAATGNLHHTIGTGADGITLQIWGGSATTVGSALTVGQWYHLAMACDSVNSVRGYLDGILNIDNNPANTVTAVKLWVGNNSETEWLDGCAENVMVFNRVLTSDEILMQSRSIRPVNFASLNSWSKMRHGQEYNDIAGSGNYWTVGGTLHTEPGKIVWPPPRRLYPAYRRAAAAGFDAANFIHVSQQQMHARKSRVLAY